MFVYSVLCCWLIWASWAGLVFWVSSRGQILQKLSGIITEINCPPIPHSLEPFSRKQGVTSLATKRVSNTRKCTRALATNGGPVINALGTWRVYGCQCNRNRFSQFPHIPLRPHSVQQTTPEATRGHVWCIFLQVVQIQTNTHPSPSIRNVMIFGRAEN